MVETLVTALHVLVALALIGIVLLQGGSKGAAMGSAFGGSSQTLFGARGPATTLAKITSGAAVIFMITSIALSILSSGAPTATVTPDTSVELPVTLPPAETPAPGGPAAEQQPEEGPLGPVTTAPGGQTEQK